MRHRSLVAATAAAWLLVAGCSLGPSDAQPTPASPSPPPLEPLPSAGDGGAIEITEIGFSVLDELDNGSAHVAWAATLRNTSETDLLTYADFELTWRSATGGTEVILPEPSPLQRIYDVAPGRVGVIGGGNTVEFVPESLDVAVDTNEWYPMRDLDAHDIRVGIEVTDFQIEVEAAVRVHVEFTSLYEHGSEQALRIVVVVRDAAGALIGAVSPEPHTLPALPSGPREQDARVRLSQWPEQAEPGGSEVTIVKVCCTWAR